DADLPATLRVRALAALTRSGPESPGVISAAYASVIPALSESPELLQVWRRYTGERARASEVDHFLALAAGSDADLRTVAYAVLVQLTALPRIDEPVRASADEAIEAAWSDAPAAAALRRAIR